MPNNASKPQSSSLIESHHLIDCSICIRAADKKYVVYENEYWLVRHSQETNIIGYFLIESRRHLLDLSQTDDEEAKTYGQILRALMQAIHAVIECQRIYTFSLGEAVPHFHLHIIPRTGSIPKIYRARGIMQYPLQPAADPSLVQEVCSRVSRAIAPKLDCFIRQ